MLTCWAHSSQTCPLDGDAPNANPGLDEDRLPATISARGLRHDGAEAAPYPHCTAKSRSAPEVDACSEAGGRTRHRPPSGSDSACGDDVGLAFHAAKGRPACSTCPAPLSTLGPVHRHKRSCTDACPATTRVQGRGSPSHGASGAPFQVWLRTKLISRAPRPPRASR